jgi:hypothetical protein
MYNCQLLFFSLYNFHILIIVVLVSFFSPLYVYIYIYMFYVVFTTSKVVCVYFEFFFFFFLLSKMKYNLTRYYEDIAFIGFLFIRTRYYKLPFHCFDTDRKVKSCLIKNLRFLVNRNYHCKIFLLI